MPIDPSVLLYGLQPQARTPYDAPDVVEERRLRVQKLREDAKVKQDAEYENQLYDWAVKSNIGPDGTPDFEGVRKSLAATAPRFLQKFDAAMNTAKKSQAETYKLEDDHRAALTGWAGSAFNNADETNYGDIFPVVQKGAPELVKQYGLNGDYQHDKGAIGAVRSAATSMVDQNKHSEELRQSALKGEYDQGLAQWIDRQGPNFKDDQATANALEGKFHELINLGAPSSMIQGWRDRGIDDLRDTFTPNTLTTPAQRAARQDTEDAAAALAANRADQGLRADQAAKATADYRATNLDIRRQELNQRLGHGTTAATPADPDVVNSYVRQIRNNTMLIANVPVARRDAVMKALELSDTDIQKLTAADLQMKVTAQNMLPMIDKMQSLAGQLNQMGLMGTVGGRWRSLVNGESSAANIAGLTDAQKQTVGEFAAAGGLLVTGIARAHGGARAGGSPAMIEHLTKLLDATNRDLPTFIGALNGERDFMNTYAHMGEPTKRDKTGAGTPPAYHYDPATKTFVKGGT
jgi:hypothetical protein